MFRLVDLYPLPDLERLSGKKGFLSMSLALLAAHQVLSVFLQNLSALDGHRVLRSMTGRNQPRSLSQFKAHLFNYHKVLIGTLHHADQKGSIEVEQ